MRSVRLLPIVIFATASLLVFKGIGLVTQGGYVLVGTTTAEAAGGGGGEKADAGGEATLVEHSLTDTTKTADDKSPTLSLSPEPAAAGYGAGDAASGDTAEKGEVAVAAEAACIPADAAADSHGGEAAADGEHAEAAVICPPEPEMPVTAEGDAIPMMQDGEGKLVPFSAGTGSEAVLVERLGERRADLETREAEMATRLALIEAAEQRLNEKTALLEKLQTQIDGLVDQNSSSDSEQFKGLIATYEAMKPKDAANILNELDLNTLLRVAKGISPRKMAPIMAKMNPKKAKDLTAALAMAPVEPTVAVTEADIANLPQIVGQ